MIGLGEILTGLKILEKLGKYWGLIRKARPAQSETVASRFISLFESHGVHRNQIPRFFSHGLTVKDVQDDISLLAKLDEESLDDACKLFGVRREWLDGAEARVYDCHDFYKSPERVAGFLKSLKDNNPDGQFDGVLVASAEHGGEALIVLSEVVGFVGEKVIYRYHLCNNWYFDYWKSRAYLTAFVAIAWKHEVYIRGVHMPQVDIKRFAYGESLLVSLINDFFISPGVSWYPEDMALKPAVFLKGVDPEKNMHGTTSALHLWLHLEEQGYMDTGLPMYCRSDIHYIFQQELVKIGKE